MKILRISFWALCAIVTLVESGVLFPLGGMNAIIAAAFMLVSVACSMECILLITEVQ